MTLGRGSGIGGGVDEVEVEGCERGETRGKGGQPERGEERPMMERRPQVES